jgi:hypothetical protein
MSEVFTQEGALNPKPWAPIPSYCPWAGFIKIKECKQNLIQLRWSLILGAGC